MIQKFARFSPHISGQHAPKYWAGSCEYLDQPLLSSTLFKRTKKTDFRNWYTIWYTLGIFCKTPLSLKNSNHNVIKNFLLLEQIELKETTTKSSDDLSSLTVTTHLNLKNNDHHHRPTTSTSTIISSTIIEELIVTEHVNFVESIDVKSADAGNGTEKSATFQKASFFPSKNPSNALQLNWILITILITASIMILH